MEVTGSPTLPHTRRRWPSERDESIDPVRSARVIRWTNSAATDQHLYFTSPSVTADDRWLVFISDRDGHPNLYAIDRLDGGSIHKLTRNAAGLLRSYVYPYGGRRGLSKASPSLDAARRRLYYIRDNAVCRVSLDADAADERELFRLPDHCYTAFTHVSPDGKTLCVPCTDVRAFDDADADQYVQLRLVPQRMKERGFKSWIYLIDTEAGAARVAAEVPFWVTHVQFDPAGSGRIVFNQEGLAPDPPMRAIPERVWCLETDGRFRHIAPEAPDEWRTHENWAPGGERIIYHGRRGGRAFVASRAWDGTLLEEVMLDDIHFVHATSAADGRRLFIDRSDGTIALVDPSAADDSRLVPLCRHGSSMRHQDSHVHPLLNPNGRSVTFTSDRAGNCDVYELVLPPEGQRLDAVNADTYAREMSKTTRPAMAFAATDDSSLRQWQTALRTELIHRLGIPRISARCAGAPAAATQRGEWREADHVREEWDLTPEPGFRVPFFLLRPLDAKGRTPLVLTPHGHGLRGRFMYAGIADSPTAHQVMTEGERDIALQAVRQGYIAIAPEARAFDEGRGRDEIRQGAPSSCTDWQMRALMFGRTLIGERVWDLMRLIDYASTRGDVDTARVAITGNSGGGTASLYAAAIDERIGVSVPGCYFCDFLDSIGSIHHCACNYFPGMAELADAADIAGLIAPRPFLAIAGRLDSIFPIAAVRRAFDRLKQIYEVAGAADRCELFVGEGGHRYYKDPAWRFIRRWHGSHTVV